MKAAIRKAAEDRVALLEKHIANRLAELERFKAELAELKADLEASPAPVDEE